MSHYPLNKGINKPLEFKGLVGTRYLFMLAGGLAGAFLGFIILRVVGANIYFSVALTLGGSIFWVTRIVGLSAKHGEHGAMKLKAKERHPKRIVNRNARLFKNLNQS